MTIKVKELPSQERLKELFDYHPDGYLIWKVSRTGKAKAGDKAGTINGGGYIVIRIGLVIYLAHRLIFMFYHGWCPNILDHIDGNPFNNKIENLREATRSQNNANQKLSRNNKCGYKGVSFSLRHGKYSAQIKVSGHQKSLGYFNNPEDAHKAYLEAAEKYFGDFARAA